MEPICDLAETRSADGVILNQIEPEDARVAHLLERGIAVATHGRTVWRDRHPSFDFDNRALGQVGTRSLIRRGRRQIR